LLLIAQTNKTTTHDAEAKKTKLNLKTTEKTASKIKKTDINNINFNKSAVFTNKKSASASVPIKDKKPVSTVAIKNNNILNKVKKFKAESSLKKLFSENPLLSLKVKANKNTRSSNNESSVVDTNTNKTKGKQEESSTAKKSNLAKQLKEIEDDQQDALMSVEKIDIAKDSSTAKKNKSGSQVSID